MPKIKRIAGTSAVHSYNVPIHAHSVFKACISGIVSFSQKENYEEDPKMDWRNYPGDHYWPGHNCYVSPTPEV